MPHLLAAGFALVARGVFVKPLREIRADNCLQEQLGEFLAVRSTLRIRATMPSGGGAHKSSYVPLGRGSRRAKADGGPLIGLGDSGGVDAQGGGAAAAVAAATVRGSTPAAMSSVRSSAAVRGDGS
jgi:hypothetical protein